MPGRASGPRRNTLVSWLMPGHGRSMVLPFTTSTFTKAHRFRLDSSRQEKRSVLLSTEAPAYVRPDGASAAERRELEAGLVVAIAEVVLVGQVVGPEGDAPLATLPASAEV
jgi:hypothetical protein